MSELKISDIQRMVDDWIKKFGGGYWSPLSMLAALVEEVGELAKALNSIEGGKGCGNMKALVEEIGDVLFALTCISNYYGIDMGDALKKCVEKYTVRDADRWIRK
jgi:NTP pyrophosphatase (non-canonical NTP hydrolase)